MDVQDLLEFQELLRKMPIVAKFISALIGGVYFFRLKNSYWKWFSVYLAITFIEECFWMLNKDHYTLSIWQYVVFLGLPLEYIFFYWLIALKSLKRKALFILSVSIYLTFTYSSAYLDGLNSALGLSSAFGTLILSTLIILEFIKQIKNENILMYRSSKMFYINIALIVYFIGSFPSLVFLNKFNRGFSEIWNAYFSYTYMSNCFMYLLFAASFIWGKQHS